MRSNEIVLHFRLFFFRPIVCRYVKSELIVLLCVIHVVFKSWNNCAIVPQIVMSYKCREEGIVFGDYGGYDEYLLERAIGNLRAEEARMAPTSLVLLLAHNLIPQVHQGNIRKALGEVER